MILELLNSIDMDDYSYQIMFGVHRVIDSWNGYHQTEQLEPAACHDNVFKYLRTMNLHGYTDQDRESTFDECRYHNTHPLLDFYFTTTTKQQIPSHLYLKKFEWLKNILDEFGHGVTVIGVNVDKIAYDDIQANCVELKLLGHNVVVQG